MTWRLVAGAALAFAPVTVTPARPAGPHPIAIVRDCAERVVDEQLGSLRGAGIDDPGMSMSFTLIGRGGEATKRCAEAAGLRCKPHEITAAGTSATTEICGKAGYEFGTIPAFEFLDVLRARSGTS